MPLKFKRKEFKISTYIKAKGFFNIHPKCLGSIRLQLDMVIMLSLKITDSMKVIKA